MLEAVGRSTSLPKGTCHAAGHEGRLQVGHLVGEGAGAAAGGEHQPAQGAREHLLPPARATGAPIAGATNAPTAEYCEGRGASEP